MSTLVAAAIQLNSDGNVERNLVTSAELIKQAAEQGAQLVVLPENFAIFGQTDHDKLAVKETIGHGPIQLFLGDQAKQHHLWIVGGTIPIAVEHSEKVQAACCVYNPMGECVAVYNKIHLFDVELTDVGERYRESDTLLAGNEVVIAPSPFGAMGLSICYDLRFPELYRTMTQQNAHIFVIPAAFTDTTGAAHWEVLLRARAIENQCFVIAANQTGPLESGRSAYGHSMIIDPWGTVIARTDETPNHVVLAELNLDQQSHLRGTFPCLSHRTL